MVVPFFLYCFSPFIIIEFLFCLACLRYKIKKKMKESNQDWFYFTSLYFLAAGFAVIHMYHVSTLFENDRHFSHLSNLEREMTFRTEMGFYYHFYKEIVNAPSFNLGLRALMHDNRTEFPEVINALQRFNLYPEIVIGGLFKIFDRITNYYDIPTKQCWEVTRGPSISPVSSCEGLGDPIYFYLEFVWLSAGLVTGVLFLYAVVLSDSFSGGFLAVLSFFYNHGHCTRVQWTPPLRESFGYPFCLIQMLTVTYCLKSSSKGSLQSKSKIFFQVLLITVSTTFSLVLWQFSQFVTATQTTAVLLIFCLGITDKKTVLIITISQWLGLLQAAILLFGNIFLFQSILFSLLLATISVVLGCENRIQKSSFRGIFIVTAVAGITFPLKALISQFNGEHDAHIFELLRSKLTNFKSFHTMLYTCSPEFDFLPFSTFYEMSITGLIPTAAFVICLILWKWWKNLFVTKHKSPDLQKAIEPDVAYNLLQLGAFTIMAAFIMRLKLFWSPHLCLMVSLIASPKSLPFKNNIKYSLFALLLALMSYHGISNIIKQRSIMGEYVNVPFEEVLTWINTETLPTDVFAGPMSIMANVLLSTGRRIVNHPHYEHQNMRERTMKVYSVFSRQIPEQVYSTLIEMGVNYVILDESWCYSRSRENCNMVDLWDLIDTENKNNEPLCPKLFSGNPEPFIRSFTNEVFVILSLKTRHFIEITPLRQFKI